MTKKNSLCNTGLPNLDKILGGVQLGDNVVFQIGCIDDYIRLVGPFVKAANNEQIPLIYFRFAEHPPVIPEGTCVRTYELHPEQGFENFLSEILTAIEHFGQGAFYVFDCLSELAVDWYSDRMLGNFFMITCPYLFDFDTVAYFALMRDHHTSLATDAIHKTAQVVLDVYRKKTAYYIHPQKVAGRYSPTMYMLHKWDEDDFIPVTKSTITAEILTSVSQPWLDFSSERRDVWARNFLNAQEVVCQKLPGNQQIQDNKPLFTRLLRMVISRDPRLLKLAEKYFEFTDLIGIGKRLIGTGLIGGKSVGMLLARAIIRRDAPYEALLLEPHDSFFIGADVFYTYLIRNKCWWPRRRLNVAEYDVACAAEVRELLLKGVFPKEIEGQFMEMLEYFGQSPIVVRSSSLLEDAYGNAFSGKYESVFCTNQGTPEERLDNFTAAVRSVYASTVSQDALAYRAHWDLLKQDEQMALLVQRVSGEAHQDHYFPQVAGVGFSFNPFVWDQDIDPRAGMLRLVFGLGTRAVDRIDDDYTRIVALNDPLRRPEATSGDVRKYAQHKVDILDLKTNSLKTKDFEEIIKKIPDFPLEVFASRDEELLRCSRDDQNIFFWVLTFEELLTDQTFIKHIRKILSTLEKAYDYPVDIEFTVNLLDQKDYRVNLLQCRPFQVKGNILNVDVPDSIPQDRIILGTKGPVIGSSRATTIDRIIYVVPEVYGKMPPSERYSIARLIGRLTHLQSNNQLTIMLIGPGRWATSSPELGVPVSFAEINKVSILCEVAAMNENLIPEVSLGTHFFNDLVEMDMLYLAVYPQKQGNALNADLILNTRNALPILIPDAATWSSAVHVFDASSSSQKQVVQLHADVLKQNALCYFS